jgi:TPR repeat protein
MLPARWFAIATLAALPLAPPVAFAGPDDDARRGIQALADGSLPDAMQWLRKAAAAGSTLGMTRLAEILDTAEDDVEARALFDKAAALGDPAAMLGLAKMMASGEGGARDAGEPRAMQVLAAAYRSGDLGLARDLAAAAEWERKLIEARARIDTASGKAPPSPSGPGRNPTAAKAAK